MAGYVSDKPLFRGGELRQWLDDQLQFALAEVGGITPDQALSRPPEQLAEELIAMFELPLPTLDRDAADADMSEVKIDVSHDKNRFIDDRGRAFYIDGTRIALYVPYEGPDQALQLRASTSSFGGGPYGAHVDGCVRVARDVPADVLERDREAVIKDLWAEIDKVDQHLEWARTDIGKWNDHMRATITQAVSNRRKKVLADRDTEAMLGVPLRRNNDVAKTYKVQPVKRRTLAPTKRTPPATSGEAFTPEPAITDEDFTHIIGDLVNVTRNFERLVETYSQMGEEQLRDQILALLDRAYGPATGESFSKHGKTDIYLPYKGSGAVFLAECKWWEGEKAFTTQAIPQLLDRYVIWRDTHAAMVLFIRNKDATSVIEKAKQAFVDHDRFLRHDGAIEDAPVYVIHKDGDPDREVKVALVTAALNA